MSQIATQTLRFYRQPTARTTVRVSEQLDSVLKLYQGRLASASVEVVRDYRAAAPLLAFEGELRQVPARRVHDAFGLAGGARRVEQVEQVLRVHRLGRTVG